MSELLGVIKVVGAVPDTANYIKGARVTLERQDGKTFSVNIPEDSWGDGVIYGLNLVYDHSGEGDHYA